MFLTLNMQMFFAEHTIDIDRISRTNQMLRENTAALTKEITTGEYKIHYEQEKLLKKIAVDILSTTSMGNPINGKVYLVSYVSTSNDFCAPLARTRNIERFKERFVKKRNSCIYCGKGDR